MKLMKKKLRLMVVIMSVMMISLIVYGAVSLGASGNRWFSSSVNTALRKVKSDVIPGRIYDRDNVPIAFNNDQGERLYHPDELTRRSLAHAVGTKSGLVKNGAETFFSYLLYAYDAGYFTRLSAALTGNLRHGHNLRLSLSSRLSRYVIDHFPSDKSGAVVVMNYRTGEVLVLSSFPNFDPNNQKGVASDPKKPYINNATQWRSAPGSTFKVITLAAAIKNIPDALNHTYTCNGALEVGDITITDAGMASHGEITLQKALTVSCNIAFAQLALELGDEKLRETAQAFGLDDHILFSDLVVENSIYPKRNRTAREIAWTGPGQSALAVTPLQMCMVAAAIANDGEMMEPKLLLQAVDNSRVGKAQMSANVYKTPLTKPEADLLTQAMREVVKSGTGRRAAVPGLPIAGKTGSSQIDGQEKTNAWFIGFIDDKTLPYAVCVVVNDAGEGSRQAAPIAAKIFEFLNQNR
ncbi:MAG: penicillin-binding transpeptidase domain-containing protein [Bacillota bacterium]|nr:penicillin-binding transpeptidase domain-containing protein [Bacillota bacterium]